MPLSFDVLGGPGQDNALYVRIDTGQAVHRLLFDCGEGVLAALDFSEVLQIDQLFFSHLHMDHVAGFDSFFRATFDRTARPNRVLGPEHTARILHHRFRGYLWNLIDGEPGSWLVSDLFPDRIATTRFELGEAFEVAHPEPDVPFAGVVLDDPAFRVEALLMDHGTPSVAYVVREGPRLNIDAARLPALGLRPGAWLKQLKEQESGPIEVDGVTRSAEDLRRALLVQTPGEAVAYLTDFLMDEAAMARLAPAVAGCKVVVCESQYRAADEELARRNHHMTCVQAAELARRAGVGELVLFHLSGRYTADEWRAMLPEARAVFAATRFPAQWGLAADG